MLRDIFHDMIAAKFQTGQTSLALRLLISAVDKSLESVQRNNINNLVGRAGFGMDELERLHVQSSSCKRSE